MYSFAICRYASSVFGADVAVVLLVAVLPPHPTEKARRVATTMRRLHTMRDLHRRFTRGRRAPALRKSRERDRDKQRDAVEQRFDEERATELLNPGNTDSENEAADDRAPDVSAPWRNGGQAEEGADRRRKKVIEAAVCLADLRLLASTHPVNPTSRPEATNTPIT